MIEIHIGDARDVLRSIPEKSVQTCVTSPPYFGLRDYGQEGQIGLEATVDAYVAALVAVFREVRRVLRDDGTLWLNLGDSYARTQDTNVPQTKNKPVAYPVHAKAGSSDGAVGRASRPGSRATSNGLKPKDLIGAPWRVAFALQADGWYLRKDNIWHKTNPMPESVRDRTTSAHEYVFHFSKGPRYYYDAVAVAEPAVTSDRNKWTDGGSEKQRGHGRRHAGFNGRYAERIATEGAPKTRNKRSVWTIATQAFKGAHFATFPEKLAEPCILAGTSEKGQCPSCGTPWKRVTARIDTGWSPTCACPSHDPVPQVVLDPFAGSGTALAVADTLGRHAVGIDLDARCRAWTDERVAAIRKRSETTAPKPRKRKIAVRTNLVQMSFMDGGADD